MIEAAVERLGGLTEALIAELDAITPDADLEAACEDEGAQCDDEGFECDLEPDADPEPDTPDWCAWQDEGDQTVLRQLRTFRFSPREIARARDRRAPPLALGGKAVQPQSVKRILTKRVRNHPL